MLLCAGVAGCGTVMTRSPGFGSSSCGAYPYQAVGADAVMFVDPIFVCTNYSTAAGIGTVVTALVSLPIDTCVDTLLLPVDVIYWADGKSRTW